MEEHQLILRTIASLKNFAGKVQNGDDLPLSDLAGFTRFICQFADRSHHGKEEDILFQAMIAFGFPVDGGPLAVMLADHDQGRIHSRALSEAADATEWTTELRTTVADNAFGYASLLVGHIDKEDNILYPMSQAHVPQERMDQMVDEFVDFNENSVGSVEIEELRALAESLTEKYPPVE
jgi:hemerythrin-like domain-containing protein